jgi:hypothetical protein
MQPADFDIVLLGDFRFPGGTSSAIAEEIKAGAAAGYRIALIHLEAPILLQPFPINPRIRALIDAGLVTVGDPDQAIEARLAIVHNPHVLQGLPLRPLALRAEQRLLVVHHPPHTTDGEPYYDVPAVRLHAEETLGSEVAWAPVGPLVRAQFERMPDSPRLVPEDWHNVIDVAFWATARTGAVGDRPVIGRHSRPDRRKWPDTREQILQVYPDDLRLRVRILGGGSFLLDAIGAYPRNWEVLPFGAVPPEDFLKTIDFFVYFHHSRWVEAFGCTIAEALASGAVAVLPRHFQELFEDGAVYCEAREVAERVRALRNDQSAFLEQSRRGRDLVAARFGHAAHLRRLEALIGPPRPPQIAVPAGAPIKPHRAGTGGAAPKRVLFLSSNGVGMGHLTRLLAIARRCPATLMPVFATMSQAVEPIEEAGYLVEYLPFHGYLGCDIYRWNKYLHQELNELIAFYEPPVVVCDFNSPFQGVVDTIKDNPQTWFVWCRRGMWRANAGAKFIEREHHFHAVLEPDDLASAFDFGLTAQSRDRTRVVPPIRLLDDQEMLPREAARRELGLDLERPAAIVQLGSGNNYDYRTALHLALDHLARSDVQVVVAEWLMSQGANNLPPSTPRVRKFPLARWYRAFDMAVSAVGYNAFHELIFARIPTVFMPNENPQQDDQLGRARYAERHGLGFCVRTREIYRLKPALDRLLDPDEQSAIRARCAALDPSNGAAEAARMIEEYAFIRRVERVRGP